MTENKTIQPVNTTQAGAISRRTIVKGAAWSVPVIAAAVAAPAHAASVACADDLMTTGQYSPITVTTEITQMPAYTSTTSGGIETRAFPTNSTLSIRSTIVYSGAKPLPAGGSISPHAALEPTRTWTISNAVVTTGASFVGAPAYDQSPTGPLNSGWSQTAGAWFVTTAPLVSGTTIVIDWEVSVTGSSTQVGSYAATRIGFPNPCPNATPSPAVTGTPWAGTTMVFPAIAAIDNTAVVTDPNSWTFAQRTVYLRPNP